jgi:hypothetical protein
LWDAGGKVGAFLCANPSKADALLNDATVFKCGNLAVAWKWGGFYILNLYPNYSTNPAGVLRNPEADALNLRHVRKILREVPIVVIACGNGHAQRLQEVLFKIPKQKLHCLRRNEGGGFLHPSRIKPEDYEAPIRAYETNA